MQFVYLLPENHAIHSCLPRNLVVESLEWLATNLSILNKFRKLHGDNFWSTCQEFKYLGILPIDNVKKRKAYLIILINWIWYMKRIQLEQQQQQQGHNSTSSGGGRNNNHHHHHRHHHHQHHRRHRRYSSGGAAAAPVQSESTISTDAHTTGSRPRGMTVYNRHESACQNEDEPPNGWDTTSSTTSSSSSSSSSGISGTSSSDSGGIDINSPSSSSTISTTRVNEIISDMVTQLEIPSTADIPDWTCV